MNSRCQKITAATALFLIFSVAQVYVQVSFAEPNPTSVPAVGSQQFTAILTTRRNQPIIVNGASTISGATILTGATIETPDQVGATINLGSLGSLDVAPNTRLTLEIDQNGYVRVTLIKGCAILRTRKNTAGEVATPQGPAGTIDPATGGVLDICFPPGAAAPTVNSGAAAAARAGAQQAGAAGAADVDPPFTTGGGISDTTGVLIGAFGEGAMIAAVIVVPCRRGRNPSPGVPRGRNDECR